jgi:hypothetical protein
MGDTRARMRFAVYLSLAVFHAALLAQRLATATLWEPGVLARYLSAAVVVLAAIAVRRWYPRRLRTPRMQVVFWLVVLLLHAVTPATDAASAIHPADLAEVLLFAPLALAAVAVTWDAGLLRMGIVTSRPLRSEHASSSQRIAARAPPAPALRAALP